MFEASQERRSRWRIFWPEVDDVDGANEAIQLGFVACVVLAGLVAIVAVFSQPSGLLDAALYAVLGFVLRRKKSRTAAVIALTLMSANYMLDMMRRGPTVGALTIILYVCLLSSVRGTFAYWRLSRVESKSAAAREALSTSAAD